MFSALILIVIVGGVGAVIIGRMNANNGQKREELQLADAVAEARRWNERLGSQVLTLTGTDEASTQAIADAAERHNAAASQISTATTVRQAELARESALEGLHYITAAREIMGLPTGPPVPPLEGQQAAGKITETRTMDYDGREFTASPHPVPKPLIIIPAALLLADQSPLVGTQNHGGHQRYAPECGRPVRQCCSPALPISPPRPHSPTPCRKYRTRQRSTPTLPKVVSLTACSAVMAATMAVSSTTYSVATAVALTFS